MSYKVTGWVWEHARQTGSEKLTLLALADMCNHEGECYPGVERIVGMVGVTHRRMQQILRKLETDKVISIVYEEGLKTKTGHTNRYTLLGYVETLKDDGVKSTTSLGVKSTTSELSVEQPDIKDSTPIGVDIPKPIELKPTEDATKDENKAVGDLIKTWLEEQSIIDSKAYSKTGYRSVALDLHRAGVTPDDIKGFLTYYNTQGFWKDKSIPWSYIQSNIQKWKELQSKPPEKTQHDIAMERAAKGLPYVFG